MKRTSGARAREAEQPDLSAALLLRRRVTEEGGAAAYEHDRDWREDRGPVEEPVAGSTFAVGR